MKYRGWLACCALVAACGGRLEEKDTAGGGGSAGQADGEAAGSTSSGAAGTAGKGGDAGLGGSASGTGESTDCANPTSTSQIDNLTTGDVWLFPAGIAVQGGQNGSVLVAYHDGNNPNVDRIYSLPRCGGEPTLLKDKLPRIWGTQMVGDTLYVGLLPWGGSSPARISKVSGGKVSTFFEGGDSISLGQGGGFFFWLADKQLRRSHQDGSSKQVIGSLPSTDAKISPDDVHLYWNDAGDALYRREHGSSTDELVAHGVSFTYNDTAHQGLERLFFYDQGAVWAFDKKTFAVTKLREFDARGLWWVPQGLLVAGFKSVELLDPATGQVLRSYGGMPAGNAWFNSITADSKYIYWATNRFVHRFPIEP